MIKQEKVKIGNRKLLHTYSDSNMCILQVETNVEYNDAYDVIPCRYTYKETDKLIEEITDK